jgi:excisionase family DNA binding protein
MSSDIRKGGENTFDASAWISQSEAARLRGVSRQAIASLAKKDRFKTLKIGGKMLLNRTDVERFKSEPRGPQLKTKRNEPESTPFKGRRPSGVRQDRSGSSRGQMRNLNSISGYPDKSTVNQLIWISQAEAARLRDISPQSISELVKRGRFTTMMVGARKFLKRSEVESFEPQLPGPDPKRKRKM